MVGGTGTISTYSTGLYLYHNLPILQIHNNISHTDTDTDIHSWLFHNKISSNYCIPYMGKSVHVHDCLLRACIGRGYFTERNGTLENTERLCTSSLQYLISTNCTPMDRARRVLHAGNHIVGT